MVLCLLVYVKCYVTTHPLLLYTQNSVVREERGGERCSEQKAMLSLHLSSPFHQTPLSAPCSPLAPLPLHGKRSSDGRSWDSAPGASRRHRPPRVAASAGGAVEPKKAGAREEEEEAAKPLPAPLQRENIPEHVAIIMDGNSRWARAKGLPTPAGHAAGYRAIKEVVKLSHDWGVKTLTLFAFSYDNWRRPKGEVDFIMMLLENAIKKDVGYFLKEGARIRIIGDMSKLPNHLQTLAKEVEDMSFKNTGIELLVAIGYSGRRDMTSACRKIAQKVKDGQLEPEDVTELVIAQELGTSCSHGSPNPDLLIRTSGEMRLSNFLLWEAAYAELFFTQTMWPDFGKDEYVEALCAYQNRHRRFGLRI